MPAILPPASGMFTGYNISYNSSSMQTSVLTPNTLNILGELQPFTLYTIRVATVSTGGQGPSQTITVMTKPGGECSDLLGGRYMGSVEYPRRWYE